MTARARPERLTREQSRSATRAALLDAAEALFLDRGFASTSIEEIAAEAGYTRGAFYGNFASKNELLGELFRDRVFGLYTEAAAQVGDIESMSDAGELLGRTTTGETPRRLAPLFFQTLAESTHDDGLREVAAGFWSGNRALLETLVQNEPGESHGLDPRLLAITIIALDIGLAIQHHVDPDAVPQDVYPAIFEALFGRH